MRYFPLIGKIRSGFLLRDGACSSVPRSNQTIIEPHYRTVIVIQMISFSFICLQISAITCWMSATQIILAPVHPMPTTDTIWCEIACIRNIHTFLLMKRKRESTLLQALTLFRTFVFLIRRLPRRIHLP